MKFEGTRGDDTLVGTTKDDVFRLEHGGVDSVMGLDGDDSVYVIQPLNALDRFDGGKGNDRIVFTGVPQHFAFNGDNLANFESAGIEAYSMGFKISVADACDPIGHSLFLQIIAHDFHSSVDASAVTGNLDVELSGQVRFTGGSGDDHIYGGRHVDAGAGNDTILGSGYFQPNETITGGAGADTFVYYRGHPRTYRGMDTITDFDVTEDKISIVARQVHKYSQLEFAHDGHGGTVVSFGHRNSVDLLHVARDTLSKSNFIFPEPGAAQAPHSDLSSRHPGFDPVPSYSTLDMLGTPAWSSGLHMMAHASIA